MSHTVREPEGDVYVAPSEAWDAIATSYDTFVTLREAGLAVDVLQLAGLQAGDSFIDIAAGTGGLGLPAADLGAKVVAIDWAPKMIELFKRQARKRGLSHAEGYVMDCHALDFEDDSFDMAGSMFGVMLVRDQLQALREMVRVIRPGGRVIVIAYGEPSKFEALQVFLDALQAVAPELEGLPDDPPPLEFQVANPAVLQERLQDAGLKGVSVDTAHQEALEMRSGRELWDWCLGSNPIPGMLVSELTPNQRTSMQTRLDTMIQNRRGRNGTATLTAPLNIGIGSK